MIRHYVPTERGFALDNQDNAREWLQTIVVSLFMVSLSAVAFTTAIWIFFQLGIRM